MINSQEKLSSGAEIPERTDSAHKHSGGSNSIEAFHIDKQDEWRKAISGSYVFLMQRQLIQQRHRSKTCLYDLELKVLQTTECATNVLH